MANEPIITLRRAVLTADPTTGSTNSGKSMLRLRVASNTSHKDQSTGQWQDDQTFYFGITLWDQAQIRLYQGLHKGDTVTVTGYYRETTGMDQNGQNTTYRNIDQAQVALLHAPKNGQPRQNSGFRTRNNAQTGFGAKGFGSGDGWGADPTGTPAF